MTDCAALLAIDVLRITTGIDATYITPGTLEEILSAHSPDIKHMKSDDCLLGDRLSAAITKIDAEEDGRFFISCVQGTISALFVPLSVIEGESYSS
jgi:hypothetical protein